MAEAPLHAEKRETATQPMQTAATSQAFQFTSPPSELQRRPQVPEGSSTADSAISPSFTRARVQGDLRLDTLAFPSPWQLANPFRTSPNPFVLRANPWHANRRSRFINPFFPCTDRLVRSTDRFPPVEEVYGREHVNAHRVFQALLVHDLSWQFRAWKVWQDMGQRTVGLSSELMFLCHAFAIIILSRSCNLCFGDVQEAQVNSSKLSLVAGVKASLSMIDLI